MSPTLAQIIAADKVVIFSIPPCPYCIRAKKLLESKGIAYKDYSVDKMGAEGEALFDEVTKTTGGHETYPAIYVNGTFVGGNSDLQEANTNGKLDELLAKK